MRESSVLQRILLAVSHGATRLFRMNVGQAWIGESARQPNGDVLVRDARPFKAGVAGMSDLCGWTVIEVTPGMVGRRVAVYTAIEAKAPGGRARPEQVTFIDQVRAAGGIAGIARSGEDAERLIEDYRSSAGC